MFHKVLTAFMICICAVIASAFTAPVYATDDTYAPEQVVILADHYNLDLVDYDWYSLDTYFNGDYDLHRLYVLVPVNTTPAFYSIFSSNGSNGTGITYQVPVDFACSTTGISPIPQTYYSNTTLDLSTFQAFQLNGDIISLPLNIVGSYPDILSFSFNIFESSLTISEMFEYTPYGNGSASNSEVQNNTDLGILASLYDVTFTPEYASNNSSVASSCIGNTYECVFQRVVSDNGYSMISLQCMPLAVSQDTVFYGTFTFNLHKPNTYKIEDFTLSFCTDVPSFEIDEPDFFIPDDSFFNVHVLDNPPDGTTLSNPVSFTVNSLRFLNTSNQVVSYSNREFIAFDYSSNSPVYPLITFKGCANSNIFSAGSFVYNFSFSDIKDGNDSVDIGELEDEGVAENGKKREDTAYIPVYITYPSDSVSFDDVSIDNYDFSSLADIFSKLFNDYIIMMMIACASVGLIGYVLFGKR